MLALPEKFSSDLEGDPDQKSGEPDPEDANLTDSVGLSPSANRTRDARRPPTSELELGDSFVKEEAIEEEVVFEEVTERSVSIRQQDSSSSSETYLSEANCNPSQDFSLGIGIMSTKIDTLFDNRDVSVASGGVKSEKTEEQDELTKEKGEKSPVSTKIDMVFDNRDVSVASGGIKSEKTEEQDELTKEKEKKSSGKQSSKVGGSGQLSSGEKLLLALDREYQMSLLAAQYYYARHFWYMFLPIVSITMTSAIFAFAVQSELPMSQDNKSMFAFFVGCSSIVSKFCFARSLKNCVVFVSSFLPHVHKFGRYSIININMNTTDVFLQNMSNELNYNHCYKSQRTLGLGLKNLRAKVEYLNSTEEGISSKEIHNIENTMETIMKQNDTQIPAPIFIAYDLVATRLNLRLFPPVCFDRSDPNEHNKIAWAGMMKIVHDELFNVFSNHRAGGWLGYCCCYLAWPLLLPDPERMVCLSIERVLEVLADERNNNLYTQLLESQELIRVGNIENAVTRQQTV